MNIPQQAVCTSDVATTLMLYCCCCCRCRCYNTETELWDKNTYTAGKWRAPEFIVSNNGGFGFSLNPVYCCLYFMYNFIFLFSRWCSARFVAVAEGSLCVLFFSLARSALVFFLSLFYCWLYIFFCAAVHRTTNTVYEQRTRIEDEFESLLLFFSSLSLDTFCIAHNKTAWLRLFQLYYTTIACW